jgi:hypothetical protein
LTSSPTIGFSTDGSPHPSAALGAEKKAGAQRSAAGRTGAFGIGKGAFIEPAEQDPALPAFQKGLALFDPEKRDKKEGEVVVPSFQADLIKAAGRAQAGLIIQLNRPGLYAGNKKEHAVISLIPLAVVNRELILQG